MLERQQSTFFQNFCFTTWHASDSCIHAVEFYLFIYLFCQIPSTHILFPIDVTEKKKSALWHYTLWSLIRCVGGAAHICINWDQDERIWTRSQNVTPGRSRQRPQATKCKTSWSSTTSQSTESHTCLRSLLASQSVAQPSTHASPPPSAGARQSASAVLLLQCRARSCPELFAGSSARFLDLWNLSVPPAVSCESVRTFIFLRESGKWAWRILFLVGVRDEERVFFLQRDRYLRIADRNNLDRVSV